MANIIGFRNSASPSPFRFLYGQRSGDLLMPLDLAFTRFAPDVADPNGVFVGDEVLGPAFKIGVIKAYAFPLGAVNPVITITPDSPAVLNAAPVIPAPRMDI